MLTILREELAKHKAFDEPAHPFVDALVAAIPFSTVPLKMKQVFAIAHLSCFATQFRRNVLLDDGTPVPVNNLSFVIADSGANKDSTHNKIKKCFRPGYQELKEYNTNWVIAKAKQDAEAAGEELYEERAIYSKYLLPVPPEFSSFTTGPGLVQYINDMARLPSMSSMIYTGELSDELSQNPHALENIKILSECYTADMEVLTENGFVLFSELQPNVKVAQWDKTTRTITFALPTGYVDKDYKGLIHTFKSPEGYDLSVTENHALVYADHTKTKIHTSRFDDIKGLTSKFFVTAGFAPEGNETLSPFERLAIAFQADGSHLRERLNPETPDQKYSVEFGFSKERKRQALLDIIEGGFSYTVYASKHLSFNCVVDLPQAPSKQLSDVFSLSGFTFGKAKAFIEEIAKWDGHTRDNSIVYTTTNKENCDFVQAVAIQCGYRTVMAKTVDDRSEVFSDVYRVNINTAHSGFSRFPVTNGTKGTGRNVRETSEYEGKVYCVEMPQGTVIVRRNGLVNFNGNCYDLGNKEVTYLKSAEHRSDEIRQQAVSALMVGSPGHILYDDTTKKRFHVAFMSKLARRSWFCYTPERLFDPDFTAEDDPIQAAIDYEAKLEADSQKAAGLVQLGVKEVTEFNIGRLGIDMPITEEVFNLFNLYKRYNREVVNALANRESVYALVRSHLQWKALKLAGAFAIMGKQDTVTAKHYVAAIQYAELFDKDIATFEQDINKAPHESMADYMKTLLNEDNKAFLSAHDIKKQGFSTTTSTPKLQELVSLCAGYDLDGVYSLADNGAGIRYEPVKRSDTIGISFKAMNFQQLYDAIAAGVSAGELSGIKQRLGAQANTGYTYGECSFADLGTMLSKDFSYCPFEFSGGNRSRDGVIGGTKWLVMDVDKTTMSADDAHLVLGGINHHIALTSDADNNYRYRVIIELDAVVTLDALEWKRFFVAIANDLGIDVDVLPQSQIFFSYRNRKTLSNTDGRPLETRDYIMKAKERGAATLTPSELSKREQNVQLNNPMETFWYAYEASAGRRSTLYYRAMRHAKDLGADLDYINKLLEDINDYIVTPMDPSRFEKLLQQAERLFTEG